MLVIDYMR